jgi:glucosamine 6-phosphate synthetase-like amidotransferase/phosphosugar isomerase protein
MRGGITYDDAMLLSQTDRELIAKLIEDNMETTKKSGLPFF